MRFERTMGDAKLRTLLSVPPQRNSRDNSQSAVQRSKFARWPDFLSYLHQQRCKLPA